MAVLVRRRAIIGSIVQPKRSCLRAATAGGVVGVFWYVWLFALPVWGFRCTPPAVTARRQDRLGCTIDPMIALRRAYTLMHVL